jgi:hypothetical protein
MSTINQAQPTTSAVPTGSSVSPLSMSYQSQSSSGGGSSGSSSTERLPAWYLQSGQNSADFFNEYLQNGLPSGGYQGDRVAGLDPYQTQGIGQAGTYLNTSSPLYGAGADQMMAGGQMMTDSALWNEPEMMRHMNPYLTGALTTVSNLANQNLMENVMPGVNSTFTGDGQFGSTRNADFLNRAIRDNQQVISNTQANMVNDAYKTAGDDYFRWGQQGAQVGQNLGALGQNMGQYGITGLNTGMNLGGLNQTQQQKELDANKAAWTENYTMPMDIYGGLTSAYNNSVGRLTNQGNSTSSASNYTNSSGSSYNF